METVDERVAVLEGSMKEQITNSGVFREDLAILKADMAHVKGDVADLRADMRGLRDEMGRRFDDVGRLFSEHRDFLYRRTLDRDELLGIPVVKPHTAPMHADRRRC